MSAAPDLSVSIVTYNSAACLDRLAQSIAAQQNISFELFLVDNASQDQTPALLSAWPNANITLNPENIGFGRAHNQNLPNFRSRYLLLLNPDLEFDPHLFAALRDFLDANPAVGIAGPTIIEGEPAERFTPRKFYPGEGMFPLEPGFTRNEYAWLSGACLTIRRDLFEALNGFDPNFFLYQEETDLCLRARRHGARIGWCSEATAIHAGRQSQLRQSPYQQARKLFEGTLKFWTKHFPPPQSLALIQCHRAAASLLLRLPTTSKRPQLEPDRLRARRDICTEWLSRHNLPHWPTATALGSILSRQAALFWASLRTGHFPLDDY